MSTIGGWLAEAGPITVAGFIAFGLGLMLIAVYWVTRPDDGRTGIHRPPVREESGEFPVFVPATQRTDTKHASPLLSRSTGHEPKHRYEGEPDEGTRLLWPTTNAARSRVVMIGKDGIDSGEEEARRTHHAGTDARLRVDALEGHEQEESREDRERGEDEGGTFPYGEESRAYPQAPPPPVAHRIFRNDATGEIIMLDEHGRKIEFES